MYRLIQFIFIILISFPSSVSGEELLIKPLRTVIDINIGETQKVELADEGIASVTLLEVEETRDEIRNAVRSSLVKVKVNEQEISLNSANYSLPVSVAGIQMDCRINKGLLRQQFARQVGI